MRIDFVAGFLTLGFEFKKIISYMRYLSKYLQRNSTLLSSNPVHVSKLNGNISPLKTDTQKPYLANSNQPMKLFFTVYFSCLHKKMLFFTELYA